MSALTLQKWLKNDNKPTCKAPSPAINLPSPICLAHHSLTPRQIKLKHQQSSIFNSQESTLNETALKLGRATKPLQNTARPSPNHKQPYSNAKNTETCNIFGLNSETCARVSISHSNYQTSLSATRNLIKESRIKTTDRNALISVN